MTSTVTKLNAERFWIEILLNSSRSLTVCCYDKAVSFSCFLVAVKRGLITKGPGRLAVLGLSPKTTRVPRLSFFLQMVFPDCRKARSSNSGWKDAAEVIL